jgi:hypothetical protein
VADDHITGRFTSRNDLADFMLRQVTERRYIRKFSPRQRSPTPPKLPRLPVKEDNQALVLTPLCSACSDHLR